MKKSLLGALILSAVTAPAFAGSVLWDNGPFVTHAGGHTDGSDVSQLQNVTLGHSVLGFSSYNPSFRLADDFTIPSGQNWTLTGVHVFGYSTNFATPPSGGNVRIWSGDPGAGGVIVYDGSATNTLVLSTFRAYRIAESVNGGPPFTDTARRVFDNELSIPSVVLGPGQYWLDFQLNPTGGATTAFTPPVTILGQANTGAGGFARQQNAAGAWTGQLTHGNGNTVDIPFILEGQVPAPGALALLGLAGLATSRRRRNA